MLNSINIRSSYLAGVGNSVTKAFAFLEIKDLGRLSAYFWKEMGFVGGCRAEAQGADMTR